MAFYALPGRLGKKEKEDADEEERSKLTVLIAHDPEVRPAAAPGAHRSAALPGPARAAAHASSAALPALLLPQTGKAVAPDGRWREIKALRGHVRLEAGAELELQGDVVLRSVSSLDSVGKKPQENVRFRGGIQLRYVVEALAGVDMRPHGPTIWHKARRPAHAAHAVHAAVCCPDLSRPGQHAPPHPAAWPHAPARCRRHAGGGRGRLPVVALR
jgi:hypothetical protein